MSAELRVRSTFRTILYQSVKLRMPNANSHGHRSFHRQTRLRISPPGQRKSCPGAPVLLSRPTFIMPSDNHRSRWAYRAAIRGRRNYGKVSGSGRYVHDAPGLKRAERVNRLLAPAAVYAHRQGMVQLVVSGAMLSNISSTCSLFLPSLPWVWCVLGVFHPSIVAKYSVTFFQYVRRCCLCPL